MKKKIFAVIAAVLICMCTVLPAFAADTDDFAEVYYRLNDLADLLTDREEEELMETLDEISYRQKMDVTIATVDDLDGYSTASEYADEIYDFCQYGYGKNKDGLLLMISMEDRDWAISTCGDAIRVFTDAGIKYIGEQIKPDLSDGRYAAAFRKFVELCDDFITQAATGKPYDRSNLPREPLGAGWIVISVAVGVVLAFCIVSGMKGKLKTVRKQTKADSYVKKDSLALTNSMDLFLYQTVSQSKKAKESDSDSSSGSSTHTSSSGTTHGGGSGKF